MKSAKVYIFLLIQLLGSFSVKAQLEKNITVGAYIGVMNSFGKNKPDATGNSKNIFSGFNPGPALGADISYTSNKYALGATMGVSSLRKENFSLFLLKVGPQIKYYLTSSDKAFSPYFLVGINASYIKLNQKSNETEFNPSSSYSVSNGNDISVSKISLEHPATKISTLLPGYTAGFGTSFYLKKSFSLFFQLECNGAIAKNNNEIKKAYSVNNSNFLSLLLSAGIKFTFNKSSSLY